MFRLVGREAEQAQLKQCFTRARTSKRQVVLINGEPGIGKTVLVEDCVRVLRHERNVSIFQGACSATAGDDTAYHPILSAIEGWHRHAAPAERERLVSVLKQHAPHWLAQFPSFMSVEEHERLTGRLRGATQEAMLRHLGNAFEAFAAQRSVVLILEDLHWSDSATLELLTEMARRTGPAKLLLLGTYRPQEVRSSQHPLAPHSALQQIAQDMPLVGLTQELMATYLDQRFPGHAFPEAFLPILSERTQGNPLFLVNMLQDLQEQEKLLYQERHWKLTATLDDIRESIPARLQTLIEQQFERLPEREYQVLEGGSVTGMEFSAAEVAAALTQSVATVERWCEELARSRRFVQRNGTVNWPDGTTAAQYRFLHPLYWEVLYYQIPPAQLQQLHERIGTRKEAAYGERGQEIAADLAVHFEHGRDLRKAVQYRQRAAHGAYIRLALQEVTEHLSHGMRLLKSLPQTPDRIEYELPMLTSFATHQIMLMPVDEEARQVFDQACRLALEEGLPPVVLEAVANIAVHLFATGQYAEALRYGEHCLTLARGTGDLYLLAVGGAAVVFPYFYQAAFLQVRDLVTPLQAKGVFLPQVQTPKASLMASAIHPRINCLSSLAWTLWVLGYPDQARQQSEALLALHQDDRELANQISTLSFAILLRQLCRDWRRCSTYIDQFDAATQDIDPVFGGGLTISWTGWVRVEQGQAATGIPLIEEGFAVWKRYGSALGHTWFLMLLAEAHLKVGQATQGLQVIADAFERMEALGERVWEAELWRLRGELLLEDESETADSEGATQIHSSTVDAEGCFQQALEIARRQEAKSLELRAAMSLARLWQAQSKHAAAYQLLGTVYHWFTEGFDTTAVRV